ncbi:hypothetical protein SAMN05421548_1427 [Paraburkholderia lycopersici]|uniref:Uncharacterized protein n=1 Tax=Paraburkholderia lycopersici TaxID=416944 RepID=A0A1G7BYY3_9BURK|nr:hypothetical protein SAMN05421548_1427 [Paraburkholderia lycopersici]
MRRAIPPRSDLTCIFRPPAQRLIDDRTAYARGIADEFAKSVEAAGGTVVKRDYTNDNALDFSAILTNPKDLRPDATFYDGAMRNRHR